jgi:hypothetical protein
MKASKEHVKTAVQIYVDGELMNKGTPNQKFVTFMGASLLLNKLDSVWPTLASNEVVSMLGIMDSAGMVDADSVINAAYSAIDKSGQVNIAGIVFNRSDIDSFQKYLQEAVSYG